MIDHFLELYAAKSGIPTSKLSQNARTLEKLKCQAENAKRVLSHQSSTTVYIEAFENGNDFEEVITRDKFDEINMDLFRKTLRSVEQALNDAKIKKEDVDEVRG